MTYCYKCRTCEHRQEDTVSTVADKRPELACEVCGKPSLPTVQGMGFQTHIPVSFHVGKAEIWPAGVLGADKSDPVRKKFVDETYEQKTRTPFGYDH